MFPQGESGVLPQTEESRLFRLDVATCGEQGRPGGTQPSGGAAPAHVLLRFSTRLCFPNITRLTLSKHYPFVIFTSRLQTLHILRVTRF